jgi:ubiquitin-protein ligase E3 C
MRALWDATIRGVLGKDPLGLRAIDLVPLVRRFLYFYTQKADATRLVLVVRCLASSISQSDIQYNYCLHLFAQPDKGAAWLSQCQRLGRVLLARLDSACDPNIPKLLWLLSDVSRWPGVETDSDLANTVQSRQVRLLESWSDHGLFAAVRQTLLQYTNAFPPTTSDSPPADTLSQAAKTNVILLVATSLRPFALAAVDAPSPHFPRLALSYLASIMSIPLLAARLNAAGLSSLLPSIVKPTVRDSCMAVLATQPQFANLGASPSHSPWDAQPGGGAHYPSAGWLLGNVMELWGGQAGEAEYLTALKMVVLQLPAGSFPRDDMPLHPLLLRQLARLQDQAFLDLLCRRIASSDSDEAMATVCVLLDVLLFKWPSASNQILNKLVFSTPIVPRLWQALKSANALALTGGHTQGAVPTPALAQVADLVALFCTCYSHLLLILDDEEFFVKEKPFPVAEAAVMVQFFKSLLYKFYWEEDASSLQPSANSSFSGAARSGLTAGSALLAEEVVPSSRPAMDEDDDEEEDYRAKVRITKVSGRAPSRLQVRVSSTFKHLRDRHARRPFCPPETWLMHIPRPLLLAEISRRTSRSLQLLREIPFVIPFDDRVQVLFDNIELDRENLRGVPSEPSEFDFGHGSVRVTIRRPHILEDAFDKLFRLGVRLKERLQITFVDEHGNVEPGIDGGGLFKEFLTELLTACFHPDLGLFRSTDSNYLYPNPDSALLDLPVDHLQLFHFVGRVVGKALYSGIQIEPQFANFFLRECLGSYNSVDDLESLDPVMYKNLMFLKKYEGDIEDLSLTFTVDHIVNGHTTTVPLVRGGADLAVTRENRVRFIYLTADYKLNKQLRAQSKAFVAGLRDLVSKDWLDTFSSDELGLLISGAPTIDLADLRTHTNYANGYGPTHEQIKWLWEMLENDFNTEQVANFLKFATGCSRAPIVGFKSLFPKFCVQLVSAGPQQETLPNSSTCMNLLRLPRYCANDIPALALPCCCRSFCNHYNDR